MALTESTVEDKIEVVGDHKHVQVRTATVIARDGTEISRSFHRHVLACSTKSGSSLKRLCKPLARSNPVCSALTSKAFHASEI